MFICARGCTQGSPSLPTSLWPLLGTAILQWQWGRYTGSATRASGAAAQLEVNAAVLTKQPAGEMSNCRPVDAQAGSESIFRWLWGMGDCSFFGRFESFHTVSSQCMDLPYISDRTLAPLFFFGPSKGRPTPKGAGHLLKHGHGLRTPCLLNNKQLVVCVDA